MRKTSPATALVLVALLAAGCKKGPSLVGKWSATITSPTGQTANATYEFKPEGGFVQTVPQGPASIAIVGDYHLDGENLTIDLKDLQLQGVPKAYEAMAKERLKPLLAKPIKAKVKFASDDEASLSTGGKTGGATLKRVKEGS